MQKNLLFAPVAAGLLALASCSKMGGLSKDNFNVTPSPLEAVAGEVPVTINGVFPEKYMKTKAVVTVTPELRYEGGRAVGQAATFQGEKVEANNQTISYKIGGNYTMRTKFPYAKGMEKSELYLTFDARIGKKVQKVPEVKVADGVISTYTLVSRTLAGATPAIAPDAYEFIVHQKQEAHIRFLIQQAQIRTSELNKPSVEEFVKTLREIKADTKNYALNNIEIAAYASPDGGEKLNARLSENREKNTTEYINRTLKKENILTNVDSRYTAQDWEGFSELVRASNIQDKEVILRLLSMYPDPEQREAQIRNLSAGFTELADEILPQLRRSRLAINYDVIGRSDSEIMELVGKDPSKLGIEELIYAGGSLSEDAKEQAYIYETAARLYPNDYRAINNLAALAYARGDYDAASAYLARIPSGANLSEADVNRGLLALVGGRTAEAEGYIAKGTGAAAQSEALGHLEIMRGNYAKAVELLKGSKTNSLGLAQILNENYSDATTTLAGVPAPDYMTAYLQAIAAMRQSNSSSALSHLGNALTLNPGMKSYAARDLEFAKLFGSASFQNLVK